MGLWLWPLTFAVGLVASLFNTAGWIAVQEKKPWLAAFCDLCEVGVVIVALQLWAIHDNDWRILASEGLGTATGTWLAIQRSGSAKE